ncbi:MAG: site-specific integrase [Peptococcaceae bacterium]|nr:site-specific integrase [Peptococcaceae bacterium]
MEQIQLKQLIDQVMAAMDAFNLSKSTIESYMRSAFAPIRIFFEKNNQVLYSKEFINTFLISAKEQLNNHEISERHYRKLRKASDLLEEYYITSALKWKTRGNRTKIKVNGYFTSLLLAYEQNNSRQLAPGTTAYIKSNILQFLKFLEDKGHKNFEKISFTEIRDFLLHTSPSHRGSMGNVLFSLRSLFKYLNETGITDLRVEMVLQKSARPRKRVLPCFSHKEVEDIFDQIDTSTAEGKRNYAILFLASHTGLRSIDIVNLKLTDIDWKKDEIRIVQRKTGKSLVLPLEADTGKAIADYILSGRPNTDSPYIFVRSIAPYTKLSDNGIGMNIIKKYRYSTGATHSAGDGKGFHALRRSIGTWMLEAGVPLPTISQVLGHHNLDSTKPYLSLHYSMLAECALSLHGIESEKEGLA